MYINHNLVKNIIKAKELTLQDVLHSAGISSNAYYSLMRKKSIIPNSFRRLAQKLNIPPSALIVDTAKEKQEHLKTAAEAERIVCTHPSLDSGTVRLTLEMLKLTPLERINRSLSHAK